MTSPVLLRRLALAPMLLAALSACGDDDSSGPGPGRFTLGAPAGAITVMAGQTSQTTIPITATGALAPVTLAATGVPDDMTVSVWPSVVVAGTTEATVIVRTNPGVDIGTQTFTVTATAEEMTAQTATVSVTTTAAPSYAISTATTQPVTIQRTQSGTVTVDIARAGFTGPITFIGDQLPRGVTITSVTTSGNTATVTINTAANAQADTASFLLVATNPGMADRQIRVRTRILAEPGVQISVPALASVRQGNDGSLTVTVNREGGFAGAVTVTLTNLPAGVTADPVVSAAGTSVEVPLTIAENATVGTSNITTSVSGTGIATKTATTALTVINTLLTSGQTVAGLANAGPRGSFYLYRINVPAGATQLRVVTTGGTGDADIYLFPPGSGSPACESFNGGNGEDCVVANPAAGTWYIYIDTWDPWAGMSLTATVTP